MSKGHVTPEEVREDININELRKSQATETDRKMQEGPSSLKISLNLFPCHYSTKNLSRGPIVPGESIQTEFGIRMLTHKRLSLEGEKVIKK